jgi:signal transduction histidine kinase
MAVLVVAAEVVRMRRERAAESRAVHRAEERRQVSEERLRMARDLHDVIGHNISLINVQATMGLDLIDAQPDQARAALGAIKTVSKDALGELRAMLAALRQDDEGAPREPAPGLGRLDGLVDLTRAAGLHVITEESGRRVQLPAAVDVTAYRIIQESLTNVARHAPGASATIRITYQPNSVLVEVVDDGRVMTSNGASSDGDAPAGQGSGIAGMRERAVALGGRLDAGVHPDGGFHVEACLPLVGAG